MTTAQAPVQTTAEKRAARAEALRQLRRAYNLSHRGLVK